jgi:hypothetical protein
MPTFETTAHLTRTSYAAVAAAPAATTPAAKQITTSPPVVQAPAPPPGYSAERFWVQWVFPGVDDGKVTAEAIKKELKANKITGDLVPQASHFQFSHRKVLSREYPGGWYVSFRVPKEEPRPTSEPERRFTRSEKRVLRSLASRSSPKEQGGALRPHPVRCAAATGMRRGVHRACKRLDRRTIPSFGRHGLVNQSLRTRWELATSSPREAGPWAPDRPPSTPRSQQ